MGAKVGRIGASSIVAVALLCAVLAACSGGGNSNKTATSAPPNTATGGTATPNVGTPPAEASAAPSATVSGETTTTPSTPSSGVRACSRADLQARASEQGVPGSIGGSLALTNISSSTCTIGAADTSSPPQLALVDGTGGIVKTTENPLPGLTANSVALPPHQSTSLTFIWSNWCAEPPAAPIAIALGLASSPAAQAPISGSDATANATPRCDDSSQPSVLQVSGFSEPR